MFLTSPDGDEFTGGVIEPTVDESEPLGVLASYVELHPVETAQVATAVPVPELLPAVPGDGRWQRGTVVEGFYLADEPGTAWAEWYRALAELGVAPMLQMPRELWRYVVELPHLADLSGADQLARVGVDPPVPTRRQWPVYQAVGEALWREGWAGVLSASAARPGEGRGLCVFRVAPRSQA